ncbi:MAG: methyl-accepting chemotaxis protein [Myxococcales bacterium]|nr:methyl-accepting chemotaxis protein [Myxococcales bacterium]MDH5306171.1 methyl-accepting chemotaxis protein [Myxococcales bacterium]
MERRVVLLVALAAGVIVSGTLALAVQTWMGDSRLALLVHALGCGAAIAIYARATASERDDLHSLSGALSTLSRGDTDTPLALPGSADAAEAAASVEKVRATIAALKSRIGDLSLRVDKLPELVGRALIEAERDAEDQEGAVEETASLFANINTSIRGINVEVENLARSNEETAASIQQMGTAIEQVAQTAIGLQESVEASTASIHQMGANIRRVAENSDEVQQVAQETAAATTEMDRAIQEVGEHVRGASEMTQRVSESAEQGSDAVNATINGIAIIRDQTLKAKRALEGLAERIDEIGQIATVIGGISDETNLLSLNAAIIAAQAGEHGKAFAVVADQVKTLAQRTSVSAKQIEEMIGSVQSESSNAVQAMGAGIQSVEEGVQRSRVAGESLEVIRGAAREANGQVAEISRATEEQARNSKHVASAANRVSENVEQISRAMGEQSTASEALLRSANTYLDMCRQMAQAMEEQRSTGRYITANSQAITELIRSIQRNTASHEEASRQVGERFDLLLQHAHKAATRIPAIAKMVTELRDEVHATQSGTHAATRSGAKVA